RAQKISRHPNSVSASVSRISRSRVSLSDGVCTGGLTVEHLKSCSDKRKRKRGNSFAWRLDFQTEVTHASRVWDLAFSESPIACHAEAATAGRSYAAALAFVPALFRFPAPFPPSPPPPSPP